MWLCVGAFATLGAGCSALSAVNLIAGEGQYTVERDIPYGAGARQTLDVYTPDAVQANADVVVFFYGGGWRSGEKNEYRFAAEALTSQGYITVIPNYRLYPEVQWPAFNADGAAAYQWVETHIGAKGGNPRRIFVMGHSAGAYIAAMVAMDSSLRRAAGSKIKPCGFVGLAGPYDFLPFAADIQPIFSNAGDPMLTQPIFYAEGDAPPMLLLTGDSDTRVNPRNSARLAEAINKKGGHAQVMVFPGAGHSSMLISLARGLRFITPILADSVLFMRNTECS